MMKSGRVMATALCALGSTSAFTGPLAGTFRSVSPETLINRTLINASHSYCSVQVCARLTIAGPENAIVVASIEPYDDLFASASRHLVRFCILNDDWHLPLVQRCGEAYRAQCRAKHADGGCGEFTRT